MKLVKYDTAVPVYLPVLQVGVQLESELLEGVGKLAKLAIIILGDRREEQVLYDVTGLSEFAIRSELQELVRAGLLFNKDESAPYRLTALGERYYSMINRVLQFNDRQMELLIDNLDGRVITEQGPLLTRSEAISQGYLLPDQLPRVFLYNRNPLQMKSYLIQTGAIQPDEADAGTLFIEAKGIKEYYQACHVTAVPFEQAEYGLHWISGLSLDGEVTPDSETDRVYVPLKRTFKRFTCQLSSVVVDSYRHLLPAIRQLQDEASELLNWQAKEVLAHCKIERECNEQVYYLDEQLGLVYDSFESGEQGEVRAVELPARYSLEDIDKEAVLAAFGLNKQEGEWTVQLRELDSVVKVVRVPVKHAIDFYEKTWQEKEPENEGLPDEFDDEEDENEFGRA